MSDKSQWLYTLRPTRVGMVTDGPTEAESVALGEHGAHLARLVEEGVVLLAGRTQDAGPETRGLPASYLESLPSEQVLRIPMRDHSRSLNLSNAVAVVMYEALRQNGFGE